MSHNVRYTIVETTDEPSKITYPPRLQTAFDAMRQICFEQFSNEPKLNTEGPYCNRTMDLWGGCWPDTLPGTTAKIPCPDIVPFDRTAFAVRKCTENGTWYINPATGNTWANYSMCLRQVSDQYDMLSIHIFIGGYSLSILMLLISLAIFVRFKQLRCERITIHKNLFLSYIFTGVSWILYFVLAASDGDTLIENPIWCQALHIVCQYFVVCNFLWMFCEGLYLNTIMVYAFSSGRILILTCHLVGWVVPAILTSIYSLLRGMDKHSAAECWLEESVLQWILYGPIVLSLVVNVIFLVNIIRLLVTKLRQMPEADQTRKATRATLILIPLLGLQYLLFPIRPEPGSNLEEIYLNAIAILVSLQGAFVSLMYCFCNGEVIQLLKRKWRQHRLMHSGTMRSTPTHLSTYTTLDPNHTPVTYCSTSHIKDPPIEMAALEDKV